MPCIIHKLSLLLAISIFFVSCRPSEAWRSSWQRRLSGDVGRAKIAATPQEHDQFQLPTMSDAGAPLSLSGNDPLVKYNGTLLFWDAEWVTPQQIAAIATSSKELRRKKAIFLDEAIATVPGLRATVAQKSAEIIAIDEAITAARRDSDPVRVRAAMQEFVDAWIDERLDLAEVSGALDVDTRREVEQQFNRYCEFKLWELATSPLILQKFKHRPTPLSLCEPYYAQRGYFVETESTSECRAEVAQGDWFNCLWKQGILRSKMIEQLVAHDTSATDCAFSGAARARAIEDWLVPEQDGTSLLRKLVTASHKFQNKRLAHMLVQDGYPSLKTLLISSAGRTFRDQFPFVTRFSNCPEAFAVKSQRGVDPVAAALKLNARDPRTSRMPVTIAELKNIGENLTPSHSEEALFPAYAGREEEAAQVLAIVVAPLTAYGERLASELGDDVRASYDDYAMNELVGGLIPLPPTHTGVLAIEGRIEANNQKAAFAGLRQVEDRILRRHYGDLLRLRNVLPRELEAARAALADSLARLVPATSAVQDENLDGATLVAEAGAALFFNTMQLELAANAGKLRASLQIAESEVVRGCSDFEQIVPCFDDGVESTQFRSLAFDGDSGKLTIEVALTHPQRAGFAVIPRGNEPEKFNQIDPNSLTGGRLRLEVYANRLGEHFRFITGKAFLIDAAGITQHEGSFSADTYPMERSQLGL